MSRIVIDSDDEDVIIVDDRSEEHRNFSNFAQKKGLPGLSSMIEGTKHDNVQSKDAADRLQHTTDKLHTTLASQQTSTSFTDTPCRKDGKDASNDTNPATMPVTSSRLKRREISAPHGQTDGASEWYEPGSAEQVERGSASHFQLQGARERQERESDIPNDTSSVECMTLGLEASRNLLPDEPDPLIIEAQQSGSRTGRDRRDMTSSTKVIPDKSLSTPRGVKRQKLDRRDEVDELSSDFHDQLPPKDQYVPRPSRSRSAQVSLPVTPQETVKKERKTRRTKSAGLVAEQQMKELKDMGFDSSPAKKALKQTAGDVQKAVEWLINAPDEHEEPSIGSLNADAFELTHTPRMLAEEQAKPATISVAEAVELDHEMDQANAQKTQKQAQPEEGQDTIEFDPGVPQSKDLPEQEKKKKGRGRPRKVAPEFEQADKPTIVLKEEVKTTKSKDNVLQETCPNPKTQPAEPDQISTEKPAISFKNAQSPRQQDSTPPPEKETTLSISPVKKHSPIRKGDMPHRVGLSKRVQIEPLLKIRRKA